jgi:(R,R)-butanediol dehydrogenase/meso-butanediol dehydrogenase/diacetyl reductase
MRAAVLPGPGKPLQIEEVPDPQAGPGQLVLRVHDCGICGTDLHMSAVPLLAPGTVMGHEFSGEVVEAGADAGEFRVGDRVCAIPTFGCGRCAFCLEGSPGLCPTMKATGLGGSPGGFAEYLLVGVRESLRLPESVSHRKGALVEPLSVGLHAVDRARLQPGSRVLVIGAGPVGLAVSLWARFFGARDVVVSERAEGRRQRAAQFGATEAIDPTRDEVGPSFERLTGAAPDVIFECVGAKGLIQECIGLAPSRSKVVIVGVCMEPDVILPGAAVIKELDLIFAIAYRKRDFDLTLSMLEQQRIASEEMVTDVVDLDGLSAAFEALKRPSSQCKLMLEF